MKRPRKRPPPGQGVTVLPPGTTNLLPFKPKPTIHKSPKPIGGQVICTLTISYTVMFRALYGRRHPDEET
jgi:hypothetical protein